jgi:hypothetical protein
MKHRHYQLDNRKNPGLQNTEENLFSNEMATKNAASTIVNHNRNYQLDVGNVLNKIHDMILHIR